MTTPRKTRRIQMGKSFENLKNLLKKLPGLGAKSAERIALHMALEDPAHAREVARAINSAVENTTPCPSCYGLSENGELCPVCANPARDASAVCVVEKASDVDAIEKSGAWRGRYHVLGGKLSPIRRIGPDKLNLEPLERRIASGGISEIMLALSNDIEGEATCHYIRERTAAVRKVKLTRIGFGLPSGSQLGFADSVTIKNALDSRKDFES